MLKKILSLPDWLADLQLSDKIYPTPEERMACIIELAHENVKRMTGGPFSAGIFDYDTGALIAVAVNRVEAMNFSGAHAEMMAGLFAQDKIKSYSFDAVGIKAVLVTSAQPCIQCLGALYWMGLVALEVGARAEDTENYGFYEGPIPHDWQAQLKTHSSITMISCDILRPDVLKVFENYKNNGGLIYNGTASKGK